MLAETLSRLETVLKPEIEADVDGRRGLLLLATDREEAVVKAVRSVSPKWLCILWISGGEGDGDHQLNKKGAAEVTINAAVVRRPQLNRERAASGLANDDDLSLLNLWAFVRGLICRVRFGTLLPDTPGAGLCSFQPAAGYLNGTAPMTLGKFTISRQTFEISEPGNATKGLKELLWAETAWTLRLALPMLPQDEGDFHKWLLCA